jgi:hypothetical protein
MKEIREAARDIEHSTSFLEAKLEERSGIERELAEFDLRMHEKRTPFLHRLQVNTHAINNARTAVNGATQLLRDQLSEQLETQK